MEGNKYFTARRITVFALLTAVIIVLQVFGSYIRIGSTNLSFVLIPIVLGGIILGPIAGALLGLIFGVITLLSGVFGIDPFTMVLFNNSPFITMLLCLSKGLFAGLISALLYKITANKNKTLASYLASASAPIVNTGLFILIALLLSNVLKENFVADGTSVIYFLLIGCAGVNFIVELLINVLLTPMIIRLIKILTKENY